MPKTKIVEVLKMLYLFQILFEITTNTWAAPMQMHKCGSIIALLLDLFDIGGLYLGYYWMLQSSTHTHHGG